jgi:hypothetical protein
MAKPISDQRSIDADDVVDARARQRQIGIGLHRMFDPIVDEETPSLFLDLLAQADQRPQKAPLSKRRS